VTPHDAGERHHGGVGGKGEERPAGGCVCAADEEREREREG